MAVLFMDSWSDRSYFPQWLWRYNTTGIGGLHPEANRSFRNAPIGQAWSDDDPGSHAIELAHVIGSMAHWTVGLAFCPVLDGATSAVFFRLEGTQTGYTDANLPNSSTQFSVFCDTDGTLKFYSGGNGIESDRGTLLYSATAGQKLTSGAWTYLEFDITLSATGSGSLTVMRDDVLFCSLTSQTIGTGSADRFAIRKGQNAYGTALWSIADVYVADSLLGPCRVTAFPMATDAIPQGFTRAGTVVNATNVQQIDEWSYAVGFTDIPDGDRTAVENDNGAVTDLYYPKNVPCYGKILAIAANMTCRSLSGSPTLQVLCRQGATRYTVAGPLSVPLGCYLAAVTGIVPPGTGNALYAQLQAIQQYQPKDNSAWSDIDVQNAAWGMQAGGTGIARVTAFSLEKLVSMRNVPYQCAGGSYSFTQ